MVNDAKDITISSEIVKVEQIKVSGIDKIQTTRKFVVTYYNESGVYARGVYYFGTLQDVVPSSSN